MEEKGMRDRYLELNLDHGLASRRKYRYIIRKRYKDRPEGTTDSR